VSGERDATITHVRTSGTGATKLCSLTACRNWADEWTDVDVTDPSTNHTYLIRICNECIIKLVKGALS
jgi:hypothetical protein